MVTLEMTDKQRGQNKAADHQKMRDSPPFHMHPAHPAIAANPPEPCPRRRPKLNELLYPGISTSPQLTMILGK